MKTVKVVAAVIFDGNKIFATQRGYGDFKDGWEFPGGKVESGEKPEDALVREIKEELDADIICGDLLCTVEYDYPGFHLSMDCFRASLKEGSKMKLLEHEAAKWLAPDELDQVGWLPADIEVVKAIKEADGSRAARPDFDRIKTFDEFKKYYWYREELIKICRDKGLHHEGGKIELYEVIEAYFAGEKILPKKKAPRSRKPLVTELTPETGLIECGFTFGPKFRDFFKKMTGQENFRFNVDMVATAKAVKESGDTSFTLGDLLDIYYGKKTYATYDRSALQWNKFVKDFCSDPVTEQYPERLKAAASLWKIVRESDMEKVYSHELLIRYKDRI